MNNITKLTVATLLGLAVFSTTASADVKKGQNIYLKKLKSACGFAGVKFTTQRTQAEWKAVYEAGNFAAEVTKICPKAKLKAKYVPDVFDFAHEYAKDSGNIPSC